MGLLYEDPLGGSEGDEETAEQSTRVTLHSGPENTQDVSPQQQQRGKCGHRPEAVKRL